MAYNPTAGASGGVILGTDVGSGSLSSTGTVSLLNATFPAGTKEIHIHAKLGTSNNVQDGFVLIDLDSGGNELTAATESPGQSPAGGVLTLTQATVSAPLTILGDTITRLIRLLAFNEGTRNIQLQAQEYIGTLTYTFAVHLTYIG